MLTGVDNKSNEKKRHEEYEKVHQKRLAREEAAQRERKRRAGVRL